MARKNLGEIIRDELVKHKEKSGASFRDIALQAGLTASTVKRVHDGTVDPTVANLEAIARFLGMRIRIE